MFAFHLLWYRLTATILEKPHWILLLFLNLFSARYLTFDYCMLLCGGCQAATHTGATLYTGHFKFAFHVFLFMFLCGGCQAATHGCHTSCSVVPFERDGRQ